MFVDPESHCSCWMNCRYGFILINNWFQELMETRTSIGGTTNQVCVAQCCLASCSHLLHFPPAQACHWAKLKSGFDEELKASMATTSIFIYTNYKLQLGCWKRALKSFRLINSIFHSAICVSVFEVCSLSFPGCQAHTMTVTEEPRLICWETAIDSQSLLCRWIKLQKRMVWKNVGAYHWINFLNAQVDWDFFSAEPLNYQKRLGLLFIFPLSQTEGARRGRHPSSITSAQVRVAHPLQDQAADTDSSLPAGSEDSEPLQLEKSPAGHRQQLCLQVNSPAHGEFWILGICILSTRFALALVVPR